MPDSHKVWPSLHTFMLKVNMWLQFLQAFSWMYRGLQTEKNIGVIYAALFHSFLNLHMFSVGRDLKRNTDLLCDLWSLQRRDPTCAENNIHSQAYVSSAYDQISSWKKLVKSAWSTWTLSSQPDLSIWRFSWYSEI